MSVVVAVVAAASFDAEPQSGDGVQLATTTVVAVESTSFQVTQVEVWLLSWDSFELVVTSVVVSVVQVAWPSY